MKLVLKTPEAAERLPKDGRKLAGLYGAVMEGKVDPKTERRAILELSRVQSGMITQLTAVGNELLVVINELNNQGNSHVAVQEFTGYYKLLRSLLIDINHGTRRARRRDDERNKDKVRGAFGTELSDKREAKLERKESKRFEGVYKDIIEALHIIRSYCEGGKKVTNEAANKAFDVVRSKFSEMMEHASELSDLLIDMGYHIKSKVSGTPGDEKNEALINKAEKLSSRRAA